MLLTKYNNIKKEVNNINSFLKSFNPNKKIKKNITDNPVKAIINCDSWRIIRTATSDDNIKAKTKIINRLKNAFWL